MLDVYAGRKLFVLSAASIIYNSSHVASFLVLFLLEPDDVERVRVCV
jgi:hypothetical protein